MAWVSALWGVLKNPRILVYLVALGAACMVGWKTYGHFQTYIALRDTVTELRHKAEELTNTITVLETKMEMAKRAQAVADEARRRAEAMAARYRSIESRINETKEDDDGPLAPVLRDTLDALGGLR